MAAVITGQYSFPTLPSMQSRQRQCLAEGFGSKAGVKEHAIRYVHPILHVGMYVVSLVGKCGPTKVILTLASHT